MYFVTFSEEERIHAAVSAELEHIWSRVQVELALAVDDPTYRIWLAPLRAVELSGERLIIEAPPQTCGWIHDRFGHLLQASLELILGPHAAIELTAPASAAQSPVGLPASSTRRRMRAPLRRTQHLEPASDL